MTRRFLPSMVLAAVAGAAACDDDNTGPSEATSFSATLNGANERPTPVTTTATGTATFTLNTSTSTITYTINVTNLTDVTGAHIHLGTTAVSGPIVVNLLPSPPEGTINGELVSGSFTAANIAVTAPISFNGLVALMREGSTYVNVHTAVNTGGEIRGQITTP